MKKEKRDATRQQKVFCCNVLPLCITLAAVKVESESPLTFRPPTDVRVALAKRKAAGENVSAIIIRAIRRLLKLKAT